MAAIASGVPGREGATEPKGVADGEIVGEPGPDVTHWGILRQDRNKWVRCKHAGHKGGEIREWPLHELSYDEVSRRWGEGEYRVCWFIIDPDHPQSSERRRSGGSGPVFSVTREQGPVAPGAASQGGVAGMPGFSEAMAFMQLADQRSTAQLTAIIGAAQALSQNRSGGLDTTTLGLILDKQQAENARLLQTMQAQHAEQIRELTARIERLGSEYDDDETEDRLVGAAKAAGVVYKRGMGFGDLAKSYLAHNPEVVLEVAKAVPTVLSSLSDLFKEMKKPQPAPRARAQVIDMQTRAPVAPEPAPAPYVPAPAGLNAHAAASQSKVPPPPRKPDPPDVLVSPECPPASPNPGT